MRAPPDPEERSPTFACGLPLALVGWPVEKPREILRRPPLLRFHERAPETIGARARSPTVPRSAGIDGKSSEDGGEAVTDIGIARLDTGVPATCARFAPMAALARSRMASNARAAAAGSAVGASSVSESAIGSTP